VAKVTRTVRESSLKQHITEVLDFVPGQSGHILYRYREKGHGIHSLIFGRVFSDQRFLTTVPALTLAR